MNLYINYDKAYDIEKVSKAYEAKGQSGFDLRMFSNESENDSLLLAPQEVYTIDTGINLVIPVGFEGQVRGRSGLACKGITIANGIGTIDSSYRGRIYVLLINNSKYNYVILKGEKIAQLVITKVESHKVIELCMSQDEFESHFRTERGSKGLGSSGR